MTVTEEHAPISRVRRAVKLPIEHEGPTHRDLGAARDQTQRVLQLLAAHPGARRHRPPREAVAQTYGIPDIERACIQPTQTAAAGNEMRREATVEVGRGLLSPMPYA